MWLIRKISDEGALKYLTTKKKSYTIGREKSDIILSDSSISRSHCIINVAPKKDCPFPVQTQSGVWIIDKKSKYGTFVKKNDMFVRIEKEKVEELSNGTVVRFGLVDNIWRLEYKPLVACISKLSKEEFEEVKSLLTSIDGKLVNKWIKQCTVVFVKDFAITLKVVLALINGVPIVTVNYLKQLVENVKQNIAWPDYKLFKPEVTEPILIPHLVSLNAEDHRRELFKGKTFVIPTEEQLEKLNEIIVAAGGKTEILTNYGNWQKLADENTIVIQLPASKIINPDKNADNFANLKNALKNQYNIRIVPETEIFQAIAYSSTEKYCNPKSQAFEIRQCSPNQNPCGDIIEEDTPCQANIDEAVEQKIISSCSQNDLSNISIKKDVSQGRKRNHSPEAQESGKKLALDKEKGSDVEEFQMDEDLEIFERAGDIADAHLISQKSSVEEPSLGRAQVPEVGGSQKRSSDNKTEVTNSSTGNISKGDVIKENLNYEIGSFWKNPEDEKPDRKQKRKAREVSPDKSNSSLPEKRKRGSEKPKSSGNIVFNKKDLNATAPASSSKTKVRKPEFMDSESKKHFLKFEDGEHGVLIRRKNAQGHGDNENKCSPLEWFNKDFKGFKIREKYVCQTVINYTQKEREEIVKKLISDGWHRSRISRKPQAGRN